MRRFQRAYFCLELFEKREPAAEVLATHFCQARSLRGMQSGIIAVAQWVASDTIKLTF